MESLELEQLPQQQPNQPDTVESATQTEPDAPAAVEPQTPVADTEQTPDDAPQSQAKLPADKAGLIAMLSELAQKDADQIANDDLSRIKQHFYQLRNDQLHLEREAWIAAGSDPDQFQPAPDAEEDQFKALLSTIRDKKAALRAQIDAQLAENERQKRQIIDRLNQMSADTDSVNLLFPEVKELQAKFKEIGDVPPTAATEIWKAYQDATERFYDQLKINKELRDYDFKKNLAEKETIAAEAEALADEPDPITAFKHLQDLHDRWRTIGPVPKDMREPLWARFKEASAEINKRYQAYFEERKNRERESEQKKETICQQIEAIDITAPTTYAAWDALTKTIIAAQEEWKTIGYASRRANNELFSRFRAACDKFFTAKAAFFKQMKDTLAENLAKKTALCERAEALSTSTDWRKTAEELTRLQQEWKKIGTVAKKHSDAIWQRFLAACDHFFEQKKLNAKGTRRTEQANLKAKREIIDQLKALDTTDRQAATAALKALQTQWQETGHVPFAEKDTLYQAYREITDTLYDTLDLRGQHHRMAVFENTVSEMEGDNNRLRRERDRLTRIYEQRKNELATYQNNLGFLNLKSKNGESMMRDMERRLQRIKDDLADLEKKIDLIDQKMK